MRLLLSTLVAGALLAYAPGAAQARGVQEPGPVKGGPPAQEAERQPTGLLVFLDCSFCDIDYLRREITFINYVRDRRDAQVHILANARESGAGYEVTFDFIGLREFAGDDVSFPYDSSRTDTHDESRAAIAQVLRVGVLHFLVKTPMIDQVEIRQDVERIGDRFLVVDPDDDPWDFWVLRIGASGSFNTEDRRSNRNANVNVSANRTTEQWKLRLNGNLRYSDRKFVLNDDSESFALTRQMSFTSHVVKSLGPHWGVSFKAAALQATFVNQDFTWGVLPGLEFSFFPYSESSRHSFTITYEFGVTRYNYIDETIFEKTAETLIDHTLEADFTAVQPWGETEISIETAQFLSAPEQWRVVLNGRLDFRVLRGLNVQIRGSWGAIRDQRYLPLRGQSDQDILLERQALATDSRSFIMVGVNYTFGSIFNNVVNPRFTGTRADFSRFF